MLAREKGQQNGDHLIGFESLRKAGPMHKSHMPQVSGSGSRVEGSVDCKYKTRALSSGLVGFVLFAALGASATSADAEDRWNVKCLDTSGQTIALKAISDDGKSYDVKAIETDDPGMHDIKAIHPSSGEQLPVKVLETQVQNADYSDVKAIVNGEELLGIKGITSSGKILSVKGYFDQDADRYNIKCLADDGDLLGLKAISPAGRVYDVKGFVGLSDYSDFSVVIEADIKAVPQSD